MLLPGVNGVQQSPKPLIKTMLEYCPVRFVVVGLKDTDLDIFWHDCLIWFDATLRIGKITNMQFIFPGGTEKRFEKL